jgi:hypothetical protein
VRFHVLRKPDPAELSGRFAALMASDTRPPSTLVGVENEYQVVDDATLDAANPPRRVDFRTIVHGLGLGRPHLDPDDPFSYRLPSGNAVTCDEAEAEIVLAPIEAEPGSATRLAAAALRERDALTARLPKGLWLRGHSTHVSVSVPTELGEPVGRVFARRFSADLIRLVASPDRCGVWVRPRPDRVEFCLDFVDGDRLVAAAVFVLAATASSLREVLEPGGSVDPPVLRVGALRPRERSGWHLACSAFHGDPFDADGSSPLELASGGTLTAAAHFATAWNALRETAAGVASNEEVAIVDAVAAHGPAGAITRPDGFAPAAAEPFDAEADAPSSPYGDALAARARDGYEVGLVALTWPVALFLVIRRRWTLRPERRTFACVPRRELRAFLDALDSGRLDPILRAYLSSRPSGRILDRPEQATSPGLFDEIGLRRALLPIEPEVSQLDLDPSPAGV